MLPATVQASSAAGLKGEIRIVEPDRAQRSIARRSAETRATVPDLELSRDVEIGAALALARDQRCSLTAILVRACALALRDCPRANAAYRDGHYELYSRVNVAVAIHDDGTFTTPTVLDADTKSLRELSDEVDAMRQLARASELTPPQLAGATFTLSDHGHRGAERWSALVTPSQAASLVAGSVRTAPVVRAGEVVAGELIGLTLGCDHRILFGAQADAFLENLSQRLERVQL
jgi:pyruvate dehydrogenase E2 component (dihydrolipoamide acetyltransferase)